MDQELKQALETLGQNWTKLPEKDQKFASDLVLKAKKYDPSPKQAYWIKKLAAETALVAVAAQPAEPKPTIEVGDFAGVIALFKVAQQHLKYPKVRLQLPDERRIVLLVAGDGKPFGSNIWYGRGTPAGAWEKSGAVDDQTEEALKALLTKLAKSPACVAAEYGKLTGNCCFCTSTLSNEKSPDVGYGPVCAERFGLPWGKKQPKALKAEAVDPEWEPKLSTEQKIFGADLANEIATLKIEVNTVAHTAMTDLMSKFEGDAAAMVLPNKLAELAAMEKAA